MMMPPSFIEHKEWYIELYDKGTFIGYGPTKLTPPHVLKEMKQWNKEWDLYAIHNSDGDIVWE